MNYLNNNAASPGNQDEFWTPEAVGYAVLLGGPTTASHIANRLGILQNLEATEHRILQPVEDHTQSYYHSPLQH